MYRDELTGLPGQVIATLHDPAHAMRAWELIREAYGESIRLFGMDGRQVILKQGTPLAELDFFAAQSLVNRTEEALRREWNPLFIALEKENPE